MDPHLLQGKKIVSAVKGILPDHNVLLNQYLQTAFNFPLDHYFTLLGPCHAEEVAAEKLSYLTFSGTTTEGAQEIAAHFNCDYINTVVNTDIYGSQFASVLKNIYALGAGIAHGLDYGDNFLSVYIANCANEMASFLQKCDHCEGANITTTPPNYNASVYLGDLLVTCYSLYSRNRTFGNMRVTMLANVFSKSIRRTAPKCLLLQQSIRFYGSMCMHQLVLQRLRKFYANHAAIFQKNRRQFHLKKTFLAALLVNRRLVLSIDLFEYRLLLFFLFC
jgi:glycerol-3-phosphate dehydrogenase